jgi:hypothetical protein
MRLSLFGNHRLHLQRDFGAGGYVSLHLMGIVAP